MTGNFLVSFKRSNKENCIVRQDTRDTVFSGIINKYRGLYYFNKELNDTTFWIYTVKIDETTITGLGNGWLQMLYLNNEVINVVKENSDLKKLIKYKNSGNRKIRLIPDKKILSNFYHTIIDSMLCAVIMNERTSNTELKSSNNEDEENYSVAEKGNFIAKNISKPCR